jgi:YjbE family integral membrane protein
MDIASNILPILQIIWVNILLSGDNAVVIALACRNLPPAQRTKAVMLGAGAAVVLRIIFTLMTTALMGLPWVKLIGGLVLLWIAIKLLVPEDDEHEIAAGHNLWKAVQTVAIADVVMSLDNVIAIAAVAKGSWALIIFGLVVSIPLVVFGSQLIMMIMDRYPVIVWAGAALLGYVAAEIMIEDTVVAQMFAGQYAHWIAEALGVFIVVFVGYLLRRKKLLGAAGTEASREGSAS